MAPSQSKVVSTELPEDLDFGVPATKKIEKRRDNDFYSDLKNIPKLCSRNDDLKETKKYLDFQRTEKTDKDLNLPRNVSKFCDVRMRDEETKPRDVENAQLKSDLKNIMKAEGAYYYEKDKQKKEENEMQSKLSKFFSIFSCLNIRCGRKPKTIDNVSECASEEESHRGCNLKASDDVSASETKEKIKKSKIVTLLVTRGPTRIRGLKETALPYLKQQINKQTWTGGGIISTDYHRKYDTLKNIPQTLLDLVGVKDDTSLYPHNVPVPLEGKYNDKNNDTLNLLMEIVNEKSDWENEQISSTHFNSLSNDVNEKTDESHCSKITANNIAEIERYLRSGEFGEERLGLERSIRDVVQNANCNFLQTESVSNENCFNNINANNNSPQMYCDKTSFSSEYHKHSSLTHELFSTNSLNTAEEKTNDLSPNVSSNDMLDSPSEKFISISEPYIGTYDMISPESSPITNPANTTRNEENLNYINCVEKKSEHNVQKILPHNYATQIGQFVENQTDYLHINALNSSSNYSDNAVSAQSQKNTNFHIGDNHTCEGTNSQYKNKLPSMESCPNIYVQENASRRSPYSENVEFSPNTQNYNHSQMTPPYSDNTSPKNSPTSLNRANHNRKFSSETTFTNNVFECNNTMSSMNCNATPTHIESSSQYLSTHGGLSSTFLSPASSLGHKSPDCAVTSKIIPDSTFSARNVAENINGTSEKSTKVKTTKDIFAEVYVNLGPDLRKGICLKIHSMKESDLLILLYTIMKDMSQSNVKEIMNVSLFHLTCERLLMSEPNIFIEAGSKLLHTSSIACCRIPILTKYLSECIIRAHGLLVERGFADKDKKVILEECDVNGNTLLHRLVIQGDAYAQSLAAILPDKDSENLKHDVLFDVEKLNSDGYSALHLACTNNGNPFSMQDFSLGDIGSAKIGEMRSTLCMAKLLLYEGNADVMYRDGKSGNTCLHLAVEAISCDVRLITTILEASDREQRKNLVNCRNYSGSTPLDLARAALKSSNRPNYPKAVIYKMKKWK